MHWSVTTINTTYTYNIAYISPSKCIELEVLELVQMKTLNAVSSAKQVFWADSLDFVTGH